MHVSSPPWIGDVRAWMLVHNVKIINREAYIEHIVVFLVYTLYKYSHVVAIIEIGDKYTSRLMERVMWHPDIRELGNRLSELTLPTMRSLMRRLLAANGEYTRKLPLFIRLLRSGRILTHKNPLTGLAVRPERPLASAPDYPEFYDMEADDYVSVPHARSLTLTPRLVTVLAVGLLGAIGALWFAPWPAWLLIWFVIGFATWFMWQWVYARWYLHVLDLRRDRIFLIRGPLRSPEVDAIGSEDIKTVNLRSYWWSNIFFGGSVAWLEIELTEGGTKIKVPLVAAVEHVHSLMEGVDQLGGNVRMIDMVRLILQRMITGEPPTAEEVDSALGVGAYKKMEAYAETVRRRREEQRVPDGGDGNGASEAPTQPLVPPYTDPS
jgi:hypothetical protein